MKKYFYLAAIVLSSQVGCAAETGSAPPEDAEKTASAETIVVEKIVNANSGMCLNVYNWGTQNGSNVVQARDCDIQTSKWQLIPITQGSEIYWVKSVSSGKYLNVYEAGYHNGDNVVQADDQHQYASQWKKVARGNGLYNFVAMHDGMCLNVYAGGRNNGDNVVQAFNCDTLASMWYEQQ